MAQPPLASRSARSISRWASLRISSAAHWAQRASIAATAALAVREKIPNPGFNTLKKLQRAMAEKSKG